MRAAENTALKQNLTPQIVPSGKGCGAEVIDVDLAALDPVTIATLHQAIRDHLAVVVRGQPITDPQLIALGKSFGELEPPGMSPIDKPFIDEFPDILVISNIMEQGVPMGNLGAGEAIWHTDMSYRPRPCTIAILHALEVPPAGGNTYFANQYMAYDALSEELKQKLDGLEVIHHETYNSAGQMRKGFKEVMDPRQAHATRFSVPIRIQGARRCSSVAVTTLTSPVCRWTKANVSLMNCGPMHHARNSCGITNGKWVTR